MDAASFPMTYSHVAYKIHEITDWYTANMSPGSSECPLVFSINAYNALPDQYKKLLDDVKEDVVKAQIQAYIDIDAKELPDAREEAEKGRVHGRAARRVPEDWRQTNH